MAFAQDIGLLFRLRADTSQAKRELNEFERTVGTSTGGIGSSFSGLAVPASIAAAGIAAITTAAIGAGLALFNLSKSTSEFGSEIFDASQKTGFGAETLSALKFAAEQAGSSFEQVTKGIVVFGAEVGKAASDHQAAIKAMDPDFLGLVLLADAQGTLELSDEGEEGKNFRFAIEMN